MYYDGQLAYETVQRILDAETARRLRLLEADLEREPFDLPPPEDIDIYDESSDGG